MASPSFGEFIASNGILASSAGITIGFATATFVKSLVADVIMPLIFLAIVKVSKRSGGFVGQFLSSKSLRFTNFVSEFITWGLIILASFLVIEAIRRHLHLSGAATQQAPVFSGAAAPASHPAVKEGMTVGGGYYASV